MSNLNKGGKASIEYTQKMVKKEQAKKQMKMKVDYMAHTQNNDVEVKRIMRDVGRSTQSNIEVIVNKDITNQEENFKKRLEEKKKKIMLSTSDITEQIETLKNKRVDQSGKGGNKSFILERNNPDQGDNISFNNIQITSEIEDVNFNKSPPTNFNEPNFMQTMESSFEKIEITPDKDQFKEHFHEIDDSISFTPGGENTINNGSKSSKLKQPKQKQIFNDIKANVDHFLSEFNYYFYEEVFQGVVEEIQRILEEKHRKTLEISKNYNNQIKEYEFLMTSGKIELYLFVLFFR